MQQNIQGGIARMKTRLLGREQIKQSSREHCSK